jgi:hypothetical protein
MSQLFLGGAKPGGLGVALEEGGGGGTSAGFFFSGDHFARQKRFKLWFSKARLKTNFKPREE